jgi:hypothetical protein
METKTVEISVQDVLHDKTLQKDERKFGDIHLMSGRWNIERILRSMGPGATYHKNDDGTYNIVDSTHVYMIAGLHYDESIDNYGGDYGAIPVPHVEGFEPVELCGFSRVITDNDAIGKTFMTVVNDDGVMWNYDTSITIRFLKAFGMPERIESRYDYPMKLIYPDGMTVWIAPVIDNPDSPSYEGATTTVYVVDMQKLFKAKPMTATQKLKKLMRMDQSITLREAFERL